MRDSRTQNSKRNIVSGIFKQVLNIGLAFVSRTMVLYLLGEQYLGLSSLFGAILSILNLADLGFTTAVVYVLYKPIAENDKPMICAIANYLRRVYSIIGGAILAAGVAIMPFLPRLISGGYPAQIDIYVLYGIYLAQTVLSYWFFAYKSALFTAMQRVDIVDNVFSLTSVSVKLGQLVLLVLFRNYYLFALLLPLGTLCNNLILHAFSKRYFPEILPKGQIPQETHKRLNRQVRAIFIGKLGDVARNSCDSIFLSAFFGLTVVAAYDNYMLIFNSLMGVLWTITGAIQASVGNSMVGESVEKNRKDFFLFDFIFTWLVGWCAICMCCLYQPFVFLWMKGEESMMLSEGNMMLICLYFYAVAINSIRNVYINGAGLFWEIKHWYLLEALGNVALNLVLGYFFGVTGIIAATLITVVLFNFLARSGVLFRCYFRSSVREFFTKHLLYFLVVASAGVLTYLLCGLITGEGIWGLLLRACLCVLLPNGIFLLVYGKTTYVKRSIAMAKNILKRS